MRTLNLGILAHVDAGKTTLTERLLHHAGVIDEIGSVDDGSTQTDSLALERQRGITIKSAVVSFAIDDVTVNLIDTPGHPDFIAEVERVLSVLDGTILVISAVEGVQAQTRVLMRALQRLHLPVLIFVNKIDCGGARDQHALRGISERLTPAIIPMGSTCRLGTRGAGFTPCGAGDAAFTARLADVLTTHDDALLAACVGGETAVAYGQLRRELAVQARRGLVHPVFFGSAITGAGVDSLMAGLAELLPAAGGDADGPVSGTVFKVERGPAGEKIAYARMFSGTLRVRDRLRFGRDGGAKITAIGVFKSGATVPRASVAAGQIGKLWGLSGVQIGDTLGAPGTRPSAPLVRPAHAGDGGRPPPPGRPGCAARRAHPARRAGSADQGAAGDASQDMLISLYGAVQKEVIQATLANDFGIDVGFREEATICIERPAGTGAAAEFIGQRPNPFLATVGLRIDPAAAGSGVRFQLEVELGSLPLAFFTAVEDTVAETLRQGIRGWQVTDVVVAMTHSGYWSPVSTAGDFRNLTPLVVMSALKQAGTRVYEPAHRFRLEIPADTLGPVFPALARLHAVPRTPAMPDSLCVLEGDIPAARVHELRQQLPALTRGEGVLESTFGGYQPVSGAIPARPRSGHNPLNREEYLLHVVRRVANRGWSR